MEDLNGWMVRGKLRPESILTRIRVGHRLRSDVIIMLLIDVITAERCCGGLMPMDTDGDYMTSGQMRKGCLVFLNETRGGTQSTYSNHHDQNQKTIITLNSKRC